MRILLIILLLVSTLGYADTESALQESMTIENNEGSNTIDMLGTSSFTTFTQHQDSRQLNLVLPKDIMAKVRKDENLQQRDRPEKVLPNLFNAGQEEADFGISAGLVKSADMKDRGDVDGAKIQIRFKQ